MIESNLIKKHLINYIKENKKKFVIYPFGDNGLNVKNILLNYFEIDPVMIVDNEYEKYSSAIVDLKTLRKAFQIDWFVILTIENKEANESLFNQLTEFVPESNMINLLDLSSVKTDLNNFKPISFLPIDNVERKNSNRRMSRELNSKIKIRIVNSSGATWNSIKSICEAIKQDDVFDLLIINTNLVFENVLNEMKNCNYNFILNSKYNIENDTPDILILTHHCDQQTYFSNCREFCDLVIVAAMQLIRYTSDIDAFWELQESAYSRFQPDYYLFDSLMYKEVMNSKYASEKMIEMGNAKFDGIFEACQKKVYEKGWEKLKGKKIILWTTDHGIYNKKVDKDVTFDLYAKTIFQYARDNQDIGIIFRPHPTFLMELERNGLWDEIDLAIIKNYFGNSSNMVFDDSITYDNAYSISDGIIADGYCGISISALPTMKPICLMFRDKKYLPYHQELIEAYDLAYTSEDLLNYLDNIKNGLDLKKDARKKINGECIKHFDGKNGWRIKEFVKEKYYDLIKNES